MFEDVKKRRNPRDIVSALARRVPQIGVLAATGKLHLDGVMRLNPGALALSREVRRLASGLPRSSNNGSISSSSKRRACSFLKLGVLSVGRDRSASLACSPART